jgi:hypothetical protein
MWDRGFRQYFGMKRRLLNLLTGLSLVVCVAVAALWVRSWFVRDWVFRSRFTALADHPYNETSKHVDLHRRAWQLLSARGRFQFGFSHTYLRPTVTRDLYPVGGPPTDQGWWQREWWAPFPPAETPLERIGFMARRTATPSQFGTGVDTGFLFAFPLWLVRPLCRPARPVGEKAPGGAARPPPRPLPQVRLRPARDPRPLPRVRHRRAGHPRRMTEPRGFAPNRTDTVRLRTR